MRYFDTFSICLVLLIFASCKKGIHNNSMNTPEILSEEDFTPIEQIDPKIYFATPDNMSSDPNNQLMQMFRQKKVADMANSKKPRPFPEDEVGKLENRSFEQPWGIIEDIFRFDWKEISTETKGYFNTNIKARVIFGNPDLKVTELALGPMAIIPTHAEPTPSVYFILGGEAEVLVDSVTAKVYTGTSIMFDSYSKKRIKNTSLDPLKVLWFSWAPEGDKSYLESGYYLTGSYPQVQPIHAILPESFDFWDESINKRYEIVERMKRISDSSSFISDELVSYSKLEKRAFYSSTPNYKSSVEVEWVDLMNMDPKSFFFAEDIKSLGSTLEMMSKLAKIKSVFRAIRSDGGYDLNYSFLAWGPQSKYITHSHAICEFYYILEGDVEYIINGKEFHGVPGNFYFHPPYYDHEMRGLRKNVPFLSISGSWIPYGRRELFALPFIMLEDVPINDNPDFPIDFDFHDFRIKKDGVKYGRL